MPRPNCTSSAACSARRSASLSETSANCRIGLDQGDFASTFTFSKLSASRANKDNPSPSGCDSAFNLSASTWCSALVRRNDFLLPPRRCDHSFLPWSSLGKSNKSWDGWTSWPSLTKPLGRRPREAIPVRLHLRARRPAPVLHWGDDLPAHEARPDIWLGSTTGGRSATTKRPIIPRRSRPRSR